MATYVVDDIGYLYNFDESPDYIYIDFYSDNDLYEYFNGTLVFINPSCNFFKKSRTSNKKDIILYYEGEIS